MHCSHVILCSLVILTLAFPAAPLAQPINPGGQQSPETFPPPAPPAPDRLETPPPTEPAPAPRVGKQRTRQPRGPRQTTSTGSVRMALAQGAFLLSASGGQGTLSYRGRQYPFRIGGGGIGAIGFSKADVVGTVENLNKIEDFPGVYLEGRVGYAAGTGVSRMRLENARGVILRLRSVTKGLALNLGGEGLVIELGNPAPRP